MVGTRSLFSAGLLALSACAQLAGLETPSVNKDDPAGSPEPGKASAPGTIDATPAPAKPGDVETLVVSTTPIVDFATDGTEVFTIGQNSVQRCQPDGFCTALITADELAVGLSLPVENVVAPLEPKAIAIGADRVLFADGRYHLVASCPIAAACNRATMGAARGNRDGEVGRGLAISGAAIVWTEGGAILSSAMPLAGQFASSKVVRDEADTKQTARIGTASTRFLWLSEKGIFGIDPPSASADRLFRGSANDFATFGASTFVATGAGLLHISADGQENNVAPGAFTRVAVSSTGKGFGARTTYAGSELVELGDALVVKLSTATIGAIAVTDEHVYFLTPEGSGSKIQRVRH